MPRSMGPLSVVEIALGPRTKGVTITRWLCDELRRAILEERLPRGTRMPSTRTFAAQYKISRRTVVTVYEQMHAEGYLAATTGSGTIVNSKIPEDWLGGSSARPVAQLRKRPAKGDSRPPLSEFESVRTARPARPFHPIASELAEFPMDLWARVSSRRLRRVPTTLLARGDVAGFRPLIEVVAAHLGSSRGVNRSADEIIIVSGVQQALDLVARLLIAPSDHVWLEDPGYSGAVDAFRRAGAEIIPVKVDECGFDPLLAARLSKKARLAYVTPAHQFVLGATMPVERRLSLLTLARQRSAYIFEDDYDSDFRFSGQPIPALQSLDRNDSVIFAGSFNKAMFPSLRIGYLAVPPTLVEPILKLRWQSDRYPPGLAQAVLCDFITEGHFGRHVRRMRELYAVRLEALHNCGNRYLAGILDLPRIEAGMNTPGRLVNGMASKQAHALATAAGIVSIPLDRFALHRRDLNGLLLGFAAFTEREIQESAKKLALALAKPPLVRGFQSAPQKSMLTRE
jgi:GntR family transcriptional regulator/MocR family aminotransferase